MPKRRLGEVLVDLGIINEDQLRTALEHARKWRKKLGQSLVENHFITEPQLVTALANHLGMQTVDLGKVNITEQLLRTIPLELVKKHDVFPAGMSREGARAVLNVAMSDPTNFTAVTELEFATGCKIQPVLAGLSQIEHMIRKHYLKIDYEPLAIAGESFDTMSQYFPAEMNVVHEGRVTKAGTGEFKTMGLVSPSAGSGERQAVEHHAARHEHSRPPSREAPAPRPIDDQSDIELKLMALLKLLIEKRIIGKEEYLAELQILLARKNQK